MNAGAVPFPGAFHASRRRVCKSSILQPTSKGVLKNLLQLHPAPPHCAAEKQRHHETSNIRRSSPLLKILPTLQGEQTHAR
jgi:hypothetical protein